MKKASLIIIIISFALSAVLAVGIKTFIAPCPIHEGENIMACHWAGQALFVIAFLPLIICVPALFLKADRWWQGLLAGTGLSLELSGAVIFAIPGRAIRLCMMNEMRCNAIMKPAVSAIGAVLFVCGIILVFLNRRRNEERN